MNSSLQELFSTFVKRISALPVEVQASSAQIAAHGILMQTENRVSLKQLCSCPCDTSSACVLFQSLFLEIFNGVNETLLNEIANDIEICLAKILFTPQKEEDSIDYGAVSVKEKFMYKVFDLPSVRNCAKMQEKMQHIYTHAAEEIEAFYDTIKSEGQYCIGQMNKFEQNLGYVTVALRIAGTKVKDADCYASDIKMCSERLLAKALLSDITEVKKRACKRLLVPWFHIAGQERLSKLLKGNEFAYVICVEESTGEDLDALVGNGDIINTLLKMLEREQQSTKLLEVNTERLIVKPTVVGRAIEKCIYHLQESKGYSANSNNKEHSANNLKMWKTFFEVLNAVAEPAVSLLKPSWSRLVKLLEYAANNGPDAHLPSLTLFSVQQLLRFTLAHTSATAIRFLVFNALQFNAAILNSLPIKVLLETILERASHPGIFSPEFRGEAQLLIRNYIMNIFSLCNSVDAKRTLLELLCHRLLIGQFTHPQFIFAVLSGILNVVLGSECKELFSCKAVNDLHGFAKTKFISQHPCLREQLSILLVQSIVPSFCHESKTAFIDGNKWDVNHSTKKSPNDTDYNNLYEMTLQNLAGSTAMFVLPDVKDLIEILNTLIPKTSFPSNIIKVSHSVVFPTALPRFGREKEQDTSLWNLVINSISQEYRKNIIQEASSLVCDYLESKRAKCKAKTNRESRHQVSLPVATFAAFIAIELIQLTSSDNCCLELPFWNELQTAFSSLYTATAFNPNERKGIVHLMASIIDFTSALRHQRQSNKERKIFRPSVAISYLYKNNLLPAIKTALGPTMHFGTFSQHLHLLESLLYDVQVEDEELSRDSNSSTLPTEARQSLTDTVEKIIANSFLLMNTPSPVLGTLISPMIAVFILSKVVQYDLNEVIKLIAKVKKQSRVPSMEEFCITIVSALLGYEMKVEKKKLPCDVHVKERLNDFISTNPKGKHLTQKERDSVIITFWEQLQEDFAWSKQLALLNFLKRIKHSTVSPQAKESCLRKYLECLEAIPRELLGTVLKGIAILIDNETPSSLTETAINSCFQSVIDARNGSADIAPLSRYCKLVLKRLISLIIKNQGAKAISEELQRVDAVIDKLQNEEKKYSGPFNIMSIVLSSTIFNAKFPVIADTLFSDNLGEKTAKIISRLLIDEPAAGRLPGTTEESLSLIVTSTPRLVSTGEHYKSESGRIILIYRLLDWIATTIKKEALPPRTMEFIFSELLNHWTVCTTIDAALKNGIRQVNEPKKSKKDVHSEKRNTTHGSDKLLYQIWTAFSLLLEASIPLHNETLENVFGAALSELLHSPSPSVRWILVATSIKLIKRLSDNSDGTGIISGMELLKKCLRVPSLKNSALQSFLGIIGHIIVNFELFHPHFLNYKEEEQAKIKMIFRDIISDVFVFLVGPLATKSVVLLVVEKMPKCALEYAFGDQSSMTQITERFKETAEFENVKRLESFYPVLDCAPLLKTTIEESLNAHYVLVPARSKELGVESITNILQHLTVHKKTNNYFADLSKFTSVFELPTENITSTAEGGNISESTKEQESNDQEEVELQRKPIAQSLAQKKKRIIFVASFLEKAANMAGICRTAEIFGVEKLLLPDITIVAQQEFQTVCLGSSQWLEINELKPHNVICFLQEMKEKGYTLVGIEQTSTSVLLQEFRFPEQCVIVVGSEIHGIPAELFPVLDMCVEIPQTGRTKSLNAHVASSIVLYEATK